MCSNHPDEDNRPFPWNHHFFSPRKSRIWTHGFPTMNVLCSCWCYWIPKLINKSIKAHMCSEQTCYICKCTKHVISTRQQIECTREGAITLFRTHGVNYASVFARRVNIPQMVVVYSSIRFQPDVTWEMGLASQDNYKQNLSCSILNNLSCSIWTIWVVQSENSTTVGLSSIHPLWGCRHGKDFACSLTWATRRCSDK